MPPPLDATTQWEHRVLAPPRDTWGYRVYRIVFDADTLAGRVFDVVLSLAIVLSVAVVMLESVASIRARHGDVLRSLEWGVTVLFTIEYVLRLVIVQRPHRYALSFYGLVDLLALVPTYASLLVPGAQSLLVVRMLRLLRVFRVLKLGRYLDEASTLRTALWASRRKIAVFVLFIFTLVIVLGALMYLVEGGQSGFTSIPRSVYWAVVTLTTVGYGDISPVTPLGQFLASVIMLMGYGILAVPTGIVTVEIANATRPAPSPDVCPRHPSLVHEADARVCRRCATPLVAPGTGDLFASPPSDS